MLADTNVELKYTDGVQAVYLNGEDVSALIRTPEISMGASAVSAIPAVRDFLLGLQRKIAVKIMLLWTAEILRLSCFPMRR